MWKLLKKVLQLLTAGFLVLGVGSLVVLVVGSLVLVAIMLNSGWRRSEDVFVRNQTSAPLLLTFTLPRSTLKTDTVWWDIAGKERGPEQEIGYAIRLTALTAEGFRNRAPCPLPVLVTGTSDTLVSSETRAGVARRWDQEPWLTRQRQVAPSASDFARGIGLRGCAASPDSVLFTFFLAPDSSFLVARHSRQQPNREKNEELLLRPTVRWVNAAGTHVDQQVPVAAALRALSAAAQLERSKSYQLTHYLNYR